MGEYDPNVLNRQLEAFAELDPEMPMVTMQLFMFVAARKIVTQKDIEVGLGLSNGATSRNVAYWSGGHKSLKMKGGLGYLNREADPQDRRYNIISLTEAGTEFYHRIIGRTDGKTKGKSVAGRR